MVVLSRLGLRGALGLEGGLWGYLFHAPIVVVAVGSAAAAAVGRSLRAGLQACAWATVLGMLLVIVAWLAEAPRWTQLGRGSLLDADTVTLGENLGDALWWTLAFFVLFALPLGVIGAALGSARERRRRAREHATPVPAA
jgi:hypothetical protein